MAKTALVEKTHGQAELEPEAWVMEVAAKSRPSIVAIYSWREVVGEVDPLDPSRIQPPHWKKEGKGSGSFISSDGYVITNAHVAGHVGAMYTVELWNGEPRKAKVTYISPTSDVALIRVEGDGYTPIPIADSRNLAEGQSVVVRGSPLAKKRSVTRGVISSLPEPLSPTDDDWDARYKMHIATDADLHHGNSGGAVLNSKGEMVGIAALVMFGYNTGSIGHAIPSAEILTLAKYPLVFIRTQELIVDLYEKRMSDKITEIKYNLSPNLLRMALRGFKEIVKGIVPAEEQDVAMLAILNDPAIQWMFGYLIQGTKKPEKYARVFQEEFPGIVITPQRAAIPRQTA